MDRARLEDYLHRQIPLSAAMQASVQSCGTGSVTLSAPREPNINHKSTVFGGSASALAILAAWSLLHLRLVAEGLDCEVVIQSNTMDYQRPIHGRFTATSSLPPSADWATFLRMLTRKGLARIAVQSTLSHEDATVGAFQGQFVAFLRHSPAPGT